MLEFCIASLARREGQCDSGAAAKPTGLHFSPVTRDALEGALRRTAALWSDRKSSTPNTWARLQDNGMRTDVSWKGPAAQYAALYGELVAAKK